MSRPRRPNNRSRTRQPENGARDAAPSLAYNAMLNAGRAVMAAKGYCAFSGMHYKTTVEFCAAILPQQAINLVVLFNRYRVRRRGVVWGGIEQGPYETRKHKRPYQKQGNS